MIRNSKKKLLTAALSLAMAASFMGSPMSAVKAAGQNDIAPASVQMHSHNFSEPQPYTESDKSYEEANSVYHFVYVDVDYKCAYCKEVSTHKKEQVDYEEHNMVGPKCTKCGYEE